MRNSRRITVTLLATSAIVAATIPSTGFAKATQQDGIDTQPDATTAATDSGEIVVTAQKREQRLQDVPAAVSVVDTGALAQTNQSRLRDFFSSVPGFQASPSPGGGGTQTLVIRGISSGTFSNPTVGIMIDEVPFGAAVTEFSPEVDPADLERIEVLRGPQGTLYGASSLGGLVKFVTTEPSTTRVFGKVEAGINGVSHGSGVGYALRGAINLPLAETLAIRVSGFTRKDPGYIDNPILGKKDVNDFSSRGGRISALWKATDNVSVKLSALFQRSVAQGQNEEVRAAGLGNYQTNYILDTGRSTKNIRAYSAVIQADLGPIDLTSVTAYSTFEATAAQDYTSIPPWGTFATNGFGVPGAPSRYRAKVKRPTQELRATFRTGPMIDWLLGGFYSDEQTLIRQAITAQAVDGTTAGTIFSYEQPINFREYAVFANPTVQLSDKFSVQFGGRYSWQTATYEAVTQSGSLYGGNTIVLPELVRRDKVFTYLVTPQYRFSRDLMLYARIATGYRPGRSNSANPNPLIPRVAAPDRTTNYEIGVKGDLIDNMLTYDVSLYQIDWKKVQLVQIDPVSSLSFTSNAGRARSKGAEVSLTLRPGSGFNLSGWLSYNKSVLTEGVVSTAAYAPTGATLPYSPRFSANASIDKRFDISADVTGTLGATFSHVSGREGTFVATPARAIYPAYSQFDLRAGLQYADWSLTLYARNVTDKRGLIGGGAGAYPPSAFVYIQPRSFGASLGKTF